MLCILRLCNLPYQCWRVHDLSLPQRFTKEITCTSIVLFTSSFCACFSLRMNESITMFLRFIAFSGTLNLLCYFKVLSVTIIMHSFIFFIVLVIIISFLPLFLHTLNCILLASPNQLSFACCYYYLKTRLSPVQENWKKLQMAFFNRSRILIIDLECDSSLE